MENSCLERIKRNQIRKTNQDCLIPEVYSLKPTNRTTKTTFLKLENPETNPDIHWKKPYEYDEMNHLWWRKPIKTRNRSLKLTLEKTGKFFRGGSVGGRKGNLTTKGTLTDEGRRGILMKKGDLDDLRNDSDERNLTKDLWQRSWGRNLKEEYQTGKLNN